MRPPVARTRAMSRATITSSATAGMPGRPSRLDHAPSCMAPPPARVRVLAVLGQGDPEAPGVLEGPAHQAGRLHPGAVVGEQADPQGGQLGHRGQALAGPAHGDGPGHRHLGGGRRRPARARCGPPRPSRAAGRCWAWPPPRCTRPARRPGSRSRWSRPPRDPAGGGGCAGRPGPGPPRSRRRRAPGPPAGRRCPSPDRGHRSRRRPRTSARRSPVWSTTVPPRITRVGRAAAGPAAGPLRHGGPPSTGPWPSRRKSTAIRTATPLLTCSVISDGGQLGHVGGDLHPPDDRPGVEDRAPRAGAWRPAGR